MRNQEKRQKVRETEGKRERNIDIQRKAKLLTIVEDNLKAPFSLVPIPRCRRGHHSIPKITPLALEPPLIMLSVQQRALNTTF